MNFNQPTHDTEKLGFSELIVPYITSWLWSRWVFIIRHWWMIFLTNIPLVLRNEAFWTLFNVWFVKIINFHPVFIRLNKFWKLWWLLSNTILQFLNIGLVFESLRASCVYRYTVSRASHFFLTLPHFLKTPRTHLLVSSDGFNTFRCSLKPRLNHYFYRNMVP